MIVGGGAEQIPAYEAAKRRGLNIVGSDANPSAPALKLADHVLIASTRDPDATAEQAREFARKHPIHGVMTIANDVPYTVARVADELRLPSISLDAARCASDKLLMKERFRSSQVPCPWFTEVADADQLEVLTADRHNQRYVLKPVDGRGARGVLLIDAQSDLPWCIDEARRWGESGRLILEKFEPGIQLSTESFVLDGQCHTPAISERNYSRLNQFKPNIIEDGGTIPATLSEHQRSVIDRVILRGATAMGITTGIVKGDLVLDQNGSPLIIELAARLSGGWFASHQIPAATGVSLVDAVISHALGEPVSVEDLSPKRNKATAIRYWFPPAGVIRRISGEQALQASPGLLHYGFFRQPGDVQPAIRMHPDRFGFVIVEGETRDEALERVESALNCVDIEISP